MQVPVKFEGFTPIFDQVVNDTGEDGKPLGLITAAVFGVIWRYCQMEKGLCEASLEKIAARVGLSSRTAIRHIEILCKKGYIRDATPDVKNIPHQYYDAGKVKMRGKIQDEGTTESHTNEQEGMTESHTGYDRESQHGMTESHLKKQYKKQKETTTTSPDDFGQFDRHPDYKQLVKFYQEEVLQSGTISSVIASDLDDILSGKIDKLNNQPIPVELVLDACREMIRANNRDIRYLFGVLANWQKRGGKPHQNGNNGKATQNEDGSYYL